MARGQGRWVELPAHLYATDSVHHCDFSGQLMMRRYFELQEQGRTFRFCSEDYARLWYEYWLPRHGAKLGLKASGEET